MRRSALLLAAAASACACPLHNLSRACNSTTTVADGLAVEWPHRECCEAFSTLRLEDGWCGPDTRESDAFRAIDAWAGATHGAYAIARTCGAPLPQCFVDVDREETVRHLTRLIDWGPLYENDIPRWDAEMKLICHESIDYWQPHIGAYIGLEEFVEYAYTLAPKFNLGAFLHTPIQIVRFEESGGDRDWVLNYTWKTAAGFAGETLDEAEIEYTILRLGFSDEPGDAFRLTYTEFSRPTYEFMSRISMSPHDLCRGALAYCPDQLFPYESMDTCVKFLSNDVADKCLDNSGGFFAGNTRACRQMHLQLALLDPIVHCPHLGPDSDKCGAAPRYGHRVTAYCSDSSPPYGADRVDRRPTLAATGALLVAAACCALALLAFGASLWKTLAQTPADRARRGELELSRSETASPRSPSPWTPRPGQSFYRRDSSGAATTYLSRSSSGGRALPRSWSVGPIRDPALDAEPVEDARLRRVGIVFRDLSIAPEQKLFGARRPRVLVRGLHGTAEPGTATAIMGPSGSGKTLLLKVLAGREKAFGLLASGRIEVTELKRAELRVVRRSRAWAAARSQFSSFASELPLSGSLTCGEQLRLYALAVVPVRREAFGRADEVSAEVGLRPHDATRVDKLSEGQYRRLLLAIRLLALPSVLALDELTSGQDSATALALTAGVANLARRGLTVLVVIHQPSSEVFSLFRRVIAVRADGDGCDVAAPRDVAAAVASLRRTQPGLALNAADVSLEALRGAGDEPLKFDPPPDLTRVRLVAERTPDPRPRPLAAAALSLARFYQSSSWTELCAYTLTALLLAAVLVSLFNPNDRSVTLKSTVAGADVVFVVFIGLTTLCGVSNFQANALACPTERARFENEAASRYGSPWGHFLFMAARDALTVSSGALLFFLGTYSGCALGPASRLMPCLIVFTLAQHAFHAAGALFFYALPGASTTGIVLSGVYNFMIFLLAGVVKTVSEMSPFWSGCARGLPSYHAMGLLVYFLFKDRRFQCADQAFPEQCYDGDAVIDFFGFRGVEDRIGLSVAVIALNYLFARLALLVLLLRTGRQRAVGEIDRPWRLQPIAKAFVELKRNECNHRRRRRASSRDEDESEFLVGDPTSPFSPDSILSTPPGADSGNKI